MTFRLCSLLGHHYQDSHEFSLFTIQNNGFHGFSLFTFLDWLGRVQSRNDMKNRFQSKHNDNYENCENIFHFSLFSLFSLFFFAQKSICSGDVHLGAAKKSEKSEKCEKVNTDQISSDHDQKSNVGKKSEN